MAVDTYSVVTRLLLEDAGIRSKLLGISAAFNEVEKATQGAKSALRGFFPAAMTTRAAEFSEAMKRAREQVGYFSMAASNAQGPAKLTSQLREANAEARALNHTLSGMRFRGGGPGGAGPGHPGGGGGPGGGHRGGIFNHGALNTLQDAQMIGQVAGTVLRPGMELGHQRFLLSQQGGSPAEVAALEAAAFRTAAKVPSLSASELMKMERELIPIMSYGHKGGEGNPAQEVIAHLADAAKMDAVLANLIPGSESGKGMSQYYNALRAGEIMNLGPHPERLNAFVNDAMRAVIASSGRINMEDFRQFASQSKSAGIALNPDEIVKYLPELMMEQGGSKIGTMAMTFLRSAVGRTTHTAADEFARLGVLDEKKIRTSGKGRNAGMIFERGAWLNENERFQSPMGWMVNTLGPRLRDSEGKIDVEAARNGDKDMVARLVRELNVLFTDRNAAGFAEMLLLQTQAMDKFHGLTEKVNTSYEQMIATDPVAAWKAFKASLKTFDEALTSDTILGSLPFLNAGTSVLGHLAEAMKGHPVATGLALGGGAIGAVGAGGYALWGLATAGPALNGSAAALTQAAGAIDVAAGRLGAGGAVGAAGAAGSAAAAAAAGGAGLLRRMLPLGLGIGAGLGTFFNGWFGGNVITPEADQPGFHKYLAENGFPSADSGHGFDSKLGPGTSSDLYNAETAGMPGGSGMAAIGSSVADAISTIVSSVTGAVASMTGQVTLTGDVHVDMGGMKEMIGHLVAEGIAHATGGAGAAPSTGARPDWSGGVMLPGPI